MSNEHIVRAWKDPGYRSSLSAAELAVLPANPAGAIEISNQDLGHAAAGAIPKTLAVYCTFTCTGTCPDGSVCCISLYCPSRWCTVCGPIYNP